MINSCVYGALTDKGDCWNDHPDTSDEESGPSYYKSLKSSSSMVVPPAAAPTTSTAPTSVSAL